MTFRLSCGHARVLTPRENWLDAIRADCIACLREAIEARTAEPVEDELEPWLREELRRGSSHLDGFTWRTDPPTDEGFGVAPNIPQMGDAD